MADFRFVGDQRTVFPQIRRADGSTLELSPGESAAVDPADQARAAEHPLLIPVRPPKTRQATKSAADAAPTENQE